MTNSEQTVTGPGVSAQPGNSPACARSVAGQSSTSAASASTDDILPAGDASIAAPLPAIAGKRRHRAGVHRGGIEQSGKARQAYAAQGGLCAYCLQPFPLRELTRDHVIPKVAGGGRDWDNIVLACPPCNSTKDDFHFTPKKDA